MFELPKKKIYKKCNFPPKSIIFSSALEKTSPFSKPRDTIKELKFKTFFKLLQMLRFEYLNTEHGKTAILF